MSIPDRDPELTKAIERPLEGRQKVARPHQKRNSVLTSVTGEPPKSLTEYLRYAPAKDWQTIRAQAFSRPPLV